MIEGLTKIEEYLYSFFMNVYKDGDDKIQKSKVEKIFEENGGMKKITEYKDRVHINFFWPEKNKRDMFNLKNYVMPKLKKHNIVKSDRFYKMEKSRIHSEIIYSKVNSDLEEEGPVSERLNKIKDKDLLKMISPKDLALANIKGKYVYFCDIMLVANSKINFYKYFLSFRNKYDKDWKTSLYSNSKQKEILIGCLNKLYKKFGKEQLVINYSPEIKNEQKIVSPSDISLSEISHIDFPGTLILLNDEGIVDLKYIASNRLYSVDDEYNISDLDYSVCVELQDKFFKTIKKGVKNAEALIELPKGTNWDNIIIQFIDGHNIRINLDNDKKYSRVSDYKEMGMEDNKKHQPNSQWEFLKLLSSYRGRLTWGDSHANDTLKKKKQLLSNSLKTCFQLSGEPFESYRKAKAYEIKINLIPESGKPYYKEDYTKKYLKKIKY